MTPEAIAAVRRSYEGLAAKPQVAPRFYEELFALEPSLRHLFPADVTLLQEHFEASIALAVRSLDDMSALHESLRELGAKHVHWGARPEDYVTAREALIAAIRALSPDWDVKLEHAWRSAVTAVMVPMLEGAAVHTAMAAVRLAAETPDVFPGSPAKL